MPLPIPQTLSLPPNPRPNPGPNQVALAIYQHCVKRTKGVLSAHAVLALNYGVILLPALVVLAAQPWYLRAPNPKPNPTPKPKPEPEPKPKPEPKP